MKAWPSDIRLHPDSYHFRLHPSAFILSSRVCIEDCSAPPAAFKRFHSGALGVECRATKPCPEVFDALPGSPLLSDKAMMSKQARRFYAFGAFRLDASERVLLGERGGVPLTPKAFDTLLVLVENSGHVIGKEELMRRVWPDSF